jgi:hypothetical protein
MANELPAGRNSHGTIDNIERTLVPTIWIGFMPPRRFHFASRTVRRLAKPLITCGLKTRWKALDQPFHIINETAVRANEAAIRRQVG